MATLTAAQVAAMTPQQMASYIAMLQSAQQTPSPNGLSGYQGIASQGGFANAQLGGTISALQGNNLTGPQQVALAPMTGGASLLYNPIKGLFGGGESTQNMQGDEDNSLISSLQGQGTAGSTLASQLQSGWANRPSEANYKGQTDASEPSDFVGYDSSGKWVNNEFADSRNESDLQVPDVAGADANYSTLGTSYANATQAQQSAFQQQMLNDGNWNESKGMLEYKDPSQATSAWQSVLAEDPSKLTTPDYAINPNSTSPGANGSSPSGLDNNLLPNPSQTQNFLGQFKLPGPFQAIADGSKQPWDINAQSTFGYPTGTNLNLWPSDGSNLPLTPYASVNTSPVTAVASPVTQATAQGTALLKSLLGGSSSGTNTASNASPQSAPLDNLIAMQRMNQVQL